MQKLRVEIIIVLASLVGVFIFRNAEAVAAFAVSCATFSFTGFVDRKRRDDLVDVLDTLQRHANLIEDLNTKTAFKAGR